MVLMRAHELPDRRVVHVQGGQRLRSAGRAGAPRPRLCVTSLVTLPVPGRRQCQCQCQWCKRHRERASWRLLGGRKRAQWHWCQQLQGSRFGSVVTEFIGGRWTEAWSQFKWQWPVAARMCAARAQQCQAWCQHCCRRLTLPLVHWQCGPQACHPTCGRTRAGRWLGNRGTVEG